MKRVTRKGIIRQQGAMDDMLYVRQWRSPLGPRQPSCRGRQRNVSKLSYFFVLFYQTTNPRPAFREIEKTQEDKPQKRVLLKGVGA